MPTPPPDPTIVTIGGINARVMIDGWRKGESLLDGGPWRDIVYLVAWADSDFFIDSLMGLVRQPGGRGGPVTYAFPHAYPNNVILKCMEAEGNPIGVPKPDPALLIGVDGYCQVLAKYRIPRFDMGGIDTVNTPGGNAFPYSEWSIEADDEVVNVPTSAILFETSGLNPSQPFPGRLPQEELELTIYNYPSMWLDPIRSQFMNVNSSLFEGWNPGCVLFRSYSLKRTISSDGTYTQRINLRFSARSIEWNQMPKDDDGGFDYVKGKTSGLRFYQASDLNQITQLFGAPS